MNSSKGKILAIEKMFNIYVSPRLDLHRVEGGADLLQFLKRESVSENVFCVFSLGEGLLKVWILLYFDNLCGTFDKIYVG